jgi:transcriptional regulator GlxA family with amidase domain
MQVAIVLYERMTALDAIGPYEVLQRAPELTPVFVGAERGPVRTENGFLGLTVDATYAEVPAPDVIVVPGGVGCRALLGPGPALDWLAAAHSHTRYTTSVCTGSLVLAAAGLLTGLTATTHWAARQELRDLGAEPVEQRVVEHLDRRIITGAGVSAGIDMALRLTELLFDETAARAAQLMIEYDPQPGYDSGNRATATTAVLTRVQEWAKARD